MIQWHYKNKPMDLEIIPHLRNQTWCRRKLLLSIVKFFCLFVFCFLFLVLNVLGIMRSYWNMHLWSYSRIHPVCTFLTLLSFVCLILWVLGCMVAASLVLPAVLTWCCVDYKHSCRSEYQTGQTLGQCGERERKRRRDGSLSLENTTHILQLSSAWAEKVERHSLCWSVF